MLRSILSTALLASCLLCAPVYAQSGDTNYTIGGMGDSPRGEYYTSPLKKLGTDLALAPYAIGAFSSLIYLAVVYPVQALFGSSHVEGVMPWLLVPIVGPWMAQYTRHVKDKPVWRAVLIGDAALQATGLVLGVLGELLSGWREAPPRTETGLQLQLGPGGVTLTYRSS